MLQKKKTMTVDNQMGRFPIFCANGAMVKHPIPSPSTATEMRYVRSVMLTLNSASNCPNPGASPVMQKLHRREKKRTEYKAA
jgi:hypothetical protein